MVLVLKIKLYWTFQSDLLLSSKYQKDLFAGGTAFVARAYWHHVLQVEGSG